MIMNYEKEYKSIVEKLKNALLCIHPGSIKKVIEDILHESNESEDERIRKWLYDYISNCPNNNFAFYGGVGKDAVLNYLEKQKEQDTYKSSKSEIDFADRYSKDVWENLMSKFNAVEGYSIGCNDVSDIVLNAILNAFKWQKEQKLTELPKSEDYGIDGLYAAVDILQKTLGEVDGYQTDDGILEHKCAISAVKELYGQKPAEWSKEDIDKMVNARARKSGTTKSEMEFYRQGIKDVLNSLRLQPKQERQIKEGDTVRIHCRKDRKNSLFYDGKVGEVIHVWDAKRNPRGHIVVRVDNGCNNGFYEDELEVL